MVYLTTTTTTTTTPFIYTTKKESVVLTWKASFRNRFCWFALCFHKIVYCIVSLYSINWPLPIGAFQDQCKQIMINKYSAFILGHTKILQWLFVFRKSHGSRQRRGTPSFSPLVKSLWCTVQGDLQLRKNVRYVQYKILLFDKLGYLTVTSNASQL